jgi:hypothetical protein
MFIISVSVPVCRSIFINLRSCGPKEAVLSLKWISERGGNPCPIRNIDRDRGCSGRPCGAEIRPYGTCMYYVSYVGPTAAVELLLYGMQASAPLAHQEFLAAYSVFPDRGLDLAWRHAGDLDFPKQLYVTERSSPTYEVVPGQTSPARPPRVVAGCIFPASPRGARVRLNFFRCKSSPRFFFLRFRACSHPFHPVPQPYPCKFTQWLYDSGKSIHGPFGRDAPAAWLMTLCNFLP